MYSQVNYAVSYYPTIYKAENSIADDKLTEALNFYQSAFQVVNNAFLIDLVNAALCAIKTNSTPIAYDLLNKMVKKGISRSYLNDFRGFEELRIDNNWIAFISKYDSLSLLFHGNAQLRRTLDSLTEKDQEFREAPL